MSSCHLKYDFNEALPPNASKMFLKILNKLIIIEASFSAKIKTNEPQIKNASFYIKIGVTSL